MIARAVTNVAPYIHARAASSSARGFLQPERPVTRRVDMTILPANADEAVIDDSHKRQNDPVWRVVIVLAATRHRMQPVA